MLAGDSQRRGLVGQYRSAEPGAAPDSGPSYPATWPVRLGPFGVPIDNMWTRGPLFIASIQALDDAMGSNHRGILAELSLAEGMPAPTH